MPSERIVEGTAGSHDILRFSDNETAAVTIITKINSVPQPSVGSEVPKNIHEETVITDIMTDIRSECPDEYASSEKDMPSNAANAGAYARGPFLLLRNCH